MANAYIYQAALLCEACAKRRVDYLRGFYRVDTGDSDDWPQGPYADGGGEADTIQFCDSGEECLHAIAVDGLKVGLPLDNPLTSDGAVELHRTVANLQTTACQPELLAEIIERWGQYL